MLTYTVISTLDETMIIPADHVKAYAARVRDALRALADMGPTADGPAVRTMWALRPLDCDPFAAPYTV